MENGWKQDAAVAMADPFPRQGKLSPATTQPSAGFGLGGKTWRSKSDSSLRRLRSE